MAIVSSPIESTWPDTTVTSQIASGGRLDIRLEGAVAKPQVPLAESAAAHEYCLGGLGIDTAPAERAFFKEDDRESPPGVGHGQGRRLGAGC